MTIKKGPTLEEVLSSFETLQLFIRVGLSLVIVSAFVLNSIPPLERFRGVVPQGAATTSQSEGISCLSSGGECP